MTTTVADYIAETLYRAGVRETFLITGGFSIAEEEQVCFVRVCKSSSVKLGLGLNYLARAAFR